MLLSWYSVNCAAGDCHPVSRNLLTQLSAGKGRLVASWMFTRWKSDDRIVVSSADREWTEPPARVLRMVLAVAEKWKPGLQKGHVHHVGRYFNFWLASTSKFYKAKWIVSFWKCWNRLCLQPFWWSHLSLFERKKRNSEGKFCGNYSFAF